MATPAPASKSSRLLEFALILALAYVLTTYVGKWFFPSEDAAKPSGVVISLHDDSIRNGVSPVLKVENHTTSPMNGIQDCLASFDVKTLSASGSGATASGAAVTPPPCTKTYDIAAGAKEDINLGSIKNALFRQNGTYEITLKTGSGLQLGTGSVLSAKLEVYEPGMWAKIFRSFITKPFLNFLVFIASILPDHNLGIGIVILTILVKLVLFWPTQRALEGQKKMQLLQPKLDAVRKEYADNPTKMQEETMRLWKEHGVNPVQSCLPILLQFPILIGLFYVVRDSSVLANSQHLLYSFYQDIGWDFNHQFLGIDLTQPSWIFPPLLVVLQFLQMKLTFQIAKMKGKKDGKDAEIDKAQQIQQQVMTYAMPLMIGFFAISFPAAVSVYWGVSTLFAIGQQMIVNREHLKV